MSLKTDMKLSKRHIYNKIFDMSTPYVVYLHTFSCYTYQTISLLYENSREVF